MDQYLCLPDKWMAEEDNKKTKICESYKGLDVVENHNYSRPDQT